MSLGTKHTLKLLGQLVIVTLALALSACGPDYGSTVLGTWKDINQERYLTIEKSPEPDAQLRAIIYAPIEAPEQVSEQADHQLAMNHLTMPASMHNGILMLEVDAGLIPVLYDQINQQVVLNGTDKYQRVPKDIAQLKLASVR